MKAIIYTLLLCFFTLSQIYSQPVWVSQPSGTSNDFNSVHFTDINTGTCVGDNGTVRRTTNSGVNWFAQNAGTPSNLRCVRFINTFTGYLVGNSGTVRKTTNGGLNWFAQDPGTANDLYAVFFLNENTGTLAGNNGTIRRTTNGGINWFAQTGGTGSHFRSVHFINENTGIVAGASLTVRRTTNGGVNWFAQSLPFTIQQELFSVWFTNANTGFIVKGNDNDSREIFRTTNGGVNWTVQNLGSNHSLRSVHFTDANTGTIVGDAGDVFRTTNGGVNWSMPASGVSTWLFSSSFANSTTGWAVGQNGVILKTTTGGANIPAAPSNLVGLPASSSTVFLAWFDNSTIEDGFGIERSANNPNNFVLAGTVPPNTLNFIDDSLTAGTTYYYRVYAFTVGGNSAYSNIVAVTVVGIEPISNIIPGRYNLYNNYPNPFNPATTIRFDLPRAGETKISIYDNNGREIETIVNEMLKAGAYEVKWNASKYSSGIYYCKMSNSEYTKIQKMVLVK